MCLIHSFWFAAVKEAVTIAKEPLPPRRRAVCSSSTAAIPCGVAWFTNTSRAWIAKTLAVPPFSALVGAHWGANVGPLGAAPPPGIADDFNRADGGLGSNWAVCQAAMAISGNKVVMAANPCSMYWNSGSFANDQWSEADITLNAAGFYMASVMVRASNVNGGSGYLARVCGSCGDVAVGKRANFSQTEFASGGSIPTTQPTTLRLRLEVQGTTLRAYVNDLLVVTTSDAELTSGRPGIQIATSNTTDCSIDNWEGGDL